MTDWQYVRELVIEAYANLLADREDRPRPVHSDPLDVLRAALKEIEVEVEGNEKAV
jgi:hypothetical protein